MTRRGTRDSGTVPKSPYRAPDLSSLEREIRALAAEREALLAERDMLVLDRDELKASRSRSKWGFVRFTACVLLIGALFDHMPASGLRNATLLILGALAGWIALSALENRR